MMYASNLLFSNDTLKPNLYVVSKSNISKNFSEKIFLHDFFYRSLITSHDDDGQILSALWKML